MDYRLVFSIYSVIFVIMLLATMYIKKIKKNLSSQMYMTLIINSLTFTFIEIAAFYILLNKTNETELIRIVWNIRCSAIIWFVYNLVCYFDILIRNKDSLTTKEYFLKQPVVLGALIALLIATTLLIIRGDLPDFSPTNMQFVGGESTMPLVIFVSVAILLALYQAFKHKKEKRNVFNCILILCIILVVFLVIQFSVVYVTFLPFITMVALYVIYHNIENPDIELLKDVIILKENIDKSSNTKLDFLFNLSYDLIAPMNAIVSLSDSLSSLETFSKEEITEDLNSIKYAGNTLLDSINNILDLSETDDQDKKANNKEYNVFELLNRMKSVTMSRIGAKQIQFDLDIADNISSKLSGDITKIQKILLNVLTNAAKYTEIGKITMKVTCTNDKDIQTLHFKISDTGNGIKDSDKPFIFSDNKDSEGSGVGLALCKKYVETLDGTIRFDSVYGAGTTFFIDIPQTIVGTRLIAQDKQEDNQTDELQLIDCSPYKVLIVDDDTLDVKVTTRLLEKYRFQITCIMSTLECIDRIKREEQFDMILLDHKMPDMDGMETMKALRDLEGYELPKIVALTANAVTGARETYMKAGFDDYISKPIDTHELDRIVKKIFKDAKPLENNGASPVVAQQPTAEAQVMPVQEPVVAPQPTVEAQPVPVQEPVVAPQPTVEVQPAPVQEINMQQQNIAE